MARPIPVGFTTLTTLGGDGDNFWGKNIWYSDAIRCHIIWCCMLSPCWLVTSPLWPHRFQFLRVHQAAVATPARVRRVDRSGWRMRRAMRSCQWPPTCSQLRNSMHHFCNTAWPVSTLKTCQYPESIKTSSTLRATHFNCNTMVNWSSHFRYNIHQPKPRRTNT